MEDDDPDDLAEASTGASVDLEGYDTFFRENYRMLIRVAMYSGASREHAEDIVSSVLGNMAVRWTEIQHPEAWARKATLNNLIKQKTRQFRQVSREAEFGRAALAAEPDSGLCRWEDRQWVEQLLSTLTPSQRDVMVPVIDGLSTQEISILLGKSPDAVRRSLCDARKRLRDHLGRDRVRRAGPEEAAR